MARVTIPQLKEHTGVRDDQLNLVCSDEDLNKIADDIDNYLSFAHALGLKDRQITEIHTNSSFPFLLKTQKVLLMWKNNNLYTATYRTLVEAALQLGQGVLAERICRLCKDRVVHAIQRATPEHNSLRHNINLLCRVISQDPQGIGDKMLSRGLLTKAQRSDLRLRTITNTDKARIIVDAIVDKVAEKDGAKYFDVIGEILKSMGVWTKDLVDSLLQSRDRRSTQKSTSHTQLVQHQRLDTDLVQEPLVDKKTQPSNKPTRRSRRPPSVNTTTTSGPPRLTDIQGRTGATRGNLDSICTDKHLKQVAKELDNFKQYGEALELKGYQLAAIETDKELTYLMKIEKVLVTWKRNNVHNATYGVLAQKCLDLKRSDIATTICTLSTEPVQESESDSGKGKTKTLTNSSDEHRHKTSSVDRPLNPGFQPQGRKYRFYCRLFGVMVLVCGMPLVYLASTGYPFPDMSSPDQPRASKGNELLNIIDPNDKPTMKQLLHFQARLTYDDELPPVTYDVVQYIGTDYKKFGICLFDDHNKINNYLHDCHEKSVCTVTKILEEWLDGKGQQPVSWSSLVDCLEKSELSIADVIKGQYYTSSKEEKEL